ncbi:hypothetical protein [Pseudoalteromonas rhizosphaerae]|uniref:hypothetical protein n=1 Tax=Pseudoalteromonas rhizosphaerae TaxID=2518973 RepID=UPI001230EB84|nr:hypothetical protein [Pseudoalteromonas rhizosphaerae]
MRFIRKLIAKRKLQRLAKIITRKTDLRTELSSDSSPKQEALDEYLYICIESDDISELMLEFNLNKDSLKEIYNDLILMSLGQWVKGQYVALSTLYNYEALGFYLVAKNSGIENSSIGETLYDYWYGNITKLDLAGLLNA